MAGSCEHGNKPSDSIKGWESWPSVWVFFTRRTLLHGFRWLLMGYAYWDTFRSFECVV